MYDSYNQNNLPLAIVLVDINAVANISWSIASKCETWIPSLALIY